MVAAATRLDRKATVLSQTTKRLRSEAIPNAQMALLASTNVAVANNYYP